MTRRQIEEYKVQATVRGISLFATVIVNGYMCERFPYPGCYEEGRQATEKAATDFFVSLAQAGLAEAFR
jgi:hypothetical protein